MTQPGLGGSSSRQVFDDHHKANETQHQPGSLHAREYRPAPGPGDTTCTVHVQISVLVHTSTAMTPVIFAFEMAVDMTDP